jgi:toxin ParE1/3/4
VKRREVVFAPEAQEDLAAIYDWIADAAGANVAMGYVERLEAWCLDFDLASERGRLREDIRPGLRIVGFERRVTVAFMVDDDRVTILRAFYGGQNWERELRQA